MGQRELYAILKDNPDIWFTAVELSLMTGSKVGRIATSLKGLIRTGMVERGYKTDWRRPFYKYVKYKYLRGKDKTK